MNKFKIGDRVKILPAVNSIPNYSEHVGLEYDVVDVNHYGDVKLSHSIFYHDPSWLEAVEDGVKLVALYAVGDKVKLLPHQFTGISDYKELTGKIFTIKSARNKRDGKFSYHVVENGWSYAEEWFEAIKLADTPDTGDMFISDWKAQSLHLATTTNMKWRAIARQLGVAETTNRNWLTSQIGSKKGRDTQSTDEVVKPPRILIWDIESAPTLAYCWGRFKQFISQDQVVSEGYLLSVAWKWLGEEETHCVMNSLSAISQEDDREVVETIHRLLEEADVIVAHNLPFDEKLSKARMVFWGMKPPASYRRIDTLAIAKKQFRFPSNKLDSLGEYLKLGRKTGHSGFSLWTGVMRGDETSRQTMVEYNIQDVNLLEDVYLRLRHWDNTLPNLAQYYDDSNVRCPACGSEDVVSTDKYTYTALAKFTEVVCTECGHRSRKRANLFDKEKRQSIGANIL